MRIRSLVHRAGLVVVLAQVGCERVEAQAQQAEPAAAESGELAVPAGGVEVEARDPGVPASDPGFDVIAEALDIETVTPGVIWLGPEATREILFVLATDTWRLEPTDSGVVLHVGTASRLAARLGLRDGDVVTALNELPVRGREDARVAMAAFTGGQRVRVALKRDGTPRQIVARLVSGRLLSTHNRIEDIVAAALHEEPEPTIERAVLVAFGAGQRRLAAHPDLVLELLGLPPDATEIELDGASVAREDLARTLGSAAAGEHLRVSAGGITVARRIVSGSIEASDLEQAIDGLPPPVPGGADLGRSSTLGLLGGSALPSTEPLTEVPPIEGIEHVDEGHVRITRARVDEWLGSSATLMKAARIVPAQKDGVTQGFKLYAIRRASPLHALGFKNGDLVTEIGGRALTSATSAMEAFTDLRKAKKVSVVLERKGKSMVKEIDVVERL